MEYINKEIGLLQDQKSLNQFQDVLMRIKRSRLKQGQRKKIFKTKKIQNILKDIFKSKIKNIRKKDDLLKNALINVQKRKRLFKKGLNKIAKMQNLSQNDFNQIALMRGLSRDEL